MATTTKKKVPAKKGTAVVKAKKAPAKKPAVAPKKQSTQAEYPTRVQALVTIFTLLAILFAVVAYARY